MPIAHKSMIRWYKENPKVVKEIIDFFKVKKGIRSRVVQYGGWAPFLYCTAGKENICLMDITERNFWHQITLKGTLHFREYIFDDSVRKIEPSHILGSDLRPHRIGMSMVFDIDAPVEKTVTTTGDNIVVDEKKLDFFDKEVFEQFNKAKEIVEREVKDLGFEYICIFSGNGIYIVCEPEYPDKIADLDADKDSKFINKYWDVTVASKMRATILDLNLEFEEKGIGCRLDDRWKTWPLYHKVMWTYHMEKFRISRVIDKGEMNYEWMNINTDPVELGIVDEVPKEPNLFGKKPNLFRRKQNLLDY